MKMFKATLEVSFPYDEVASPLALGAQVEAALAGGKAQIVDNIVAGHESGAVIAVTLDTGIVNVRPKKPAAEAPPVEPLHDPNQTDLEDAVNAAKAQEPEPAA